MKEETIFINTSLDTHLALPLFGTDTVADVKGKIMHRHLVRYPDMGPITICAVKVKYGGKFYPLADRMLLTPAYARIFSTWFLYVDVNRGGHVAGEDQISNSMYHLMKEYMLFIDTNLDTHLALAISETDTVSDIKGKIMHDHFIHYPGSGPINIFAVKVLRGEIFCPLTDELLVTPAFTSVGCPWFLNVDVTRDDHVADEDHISNDMTEKPCLAADLVSPGASTGDPLS